MSESITRENLVLGQMYKDTFSGAEGKAYAVCIYFSGEAQVQLRHLTRGKEMKDFWTDISLLEVIGSTEKPEFNPNLRAGTFD